MQIIIIVRLSDDNYNHRHYNNYDLNEREGGRDLSPSLTNAAFNIIIAIIIIHPRPLLMPVHQVLNLFIIIILMMMRKVIPWSHTIHRYMYINGNP